MREIYIFGHKKPDTDSVTSSIALSYLKNELGIKCKPMILDRINNETKFVLDYFNIKTPEYLEDVKLQIKDLNYYKNCFIDEETSISKTYQYMTDKNITGVPIVDKNLKFKGILTSKMIGNELINGNLVKLKTSYNNILEVLKAEEILKFDEEILGNIKIAPFTNVEISNLSYDTIMIVSDINHIEEAVKNKIKLLIVIGNIELKEEYINIARQNKVNILRTHYDTFHTARLIGLSNYVKNILSSIRNISFNQNDYYDDFKERCIKFGYNNYPVIDDNHKCLGLIRITDINKIDRKQVILVDHNESSQSVEGLSEAEIIEIVDHHKIGSLNTNMPINFRNMAVGSTNSIIYSMFNESNVPIPKDIAGLMLSGIVSDTLKFTSPTTTEFDKFVARKLADIASINVDEYANSMFKAGTNLKGKTIDEIIEADIKVFKVGNKTIAISQVVTLNSEEILNKKDEYIYKLNEMKINRGLDLMLLSVTDIIKNGSYIFFNSSSEEIVARAFNFENIEEGYFFYKCLSRKKQLVPLFMNILKVSN